MEESWCDDNFSSNPPFLRTSSPSRSTLGSHSSRTATRAELSLPRASGAWGHNNNNDDDYNDDDYNDNDDKNDNYDNDDDENDDNYANDDKTECVFLKRMTTTTMTTTKMKWPTECSYFSSFFQK